MPVSPAKAEPLLPVWLEKAYRISLKPCGPGFSGPAVPSGSTLASAVKPRMLAPRTSATSIAILISKASTFLPRYSGVRPTIRPAMNTARIAPMTSIPYMPAPMPPGVISPSSMLNSGTSPAIGWKLSCQELIAPVLVPVVAAMNSPPTAAPKRTSLPSMLPRPAWSTPAGKSGLPCELDGASRRSAPTSRMAAIAPKIVQPWRWLPAYRPNV